MWRMAVIVICALNPLSITVARADAVTLSVRFIDGAPDSWHRDALASNTRTYGDEGCVVEVSEDQAASIINYFKQTNHRVAKYSVRTGNHWGTDEGFSALVRFTYVDGTYFSIGDNLYFQDVDGQYYTISQSTWMNLLQKSYDLMESKGCHY